MGLSSLAVTPALFAREAAGKAPLAPGLPPDVPAKGSVVQTANGIPELFVHGEKASRMWGRLALPGDYGPEKLDMYAPAGINTYFTSLDTGISLCWDGEDEFYFDKYEAHVRRLVAKQPDIRLILFVGGTGGSPYRWCKKYEEELTTFDSGQQLESASIASQQWWKDSGRAMAEFVKYFNQSKFADNIIGFNPIYNANEWFSHHRKAGNDFGWPDFSKPMLLGFRAWLKERYSDEQALRQSWKDPNITFKTVEIPSKETRLNSGHETFFYTETPVGNRVADYYRYYDETLARLGIHWCKTLKEASDVPRLAGMMYGYSYCGRHDSGLYPHHHGHGMAMLAMESPWVDFMHSPYHYYNRSVDGPHYSQHSVDTVKNHGKLMVDQIDSKPHLRHGKNANAYTPWESQQLIKRDVSYALTKNLLCYWLEGGPGNMFPIVRHSPERWGRLWYDDPEILATIGQLKKLVDEAQATENRSVTEMAIFTSPEGLYTRKMEKMFGNFYVEALRQWILPETGVPFDDYLLEDLPNIERKYKLYLFMDCHYMPEKLRQQVRQKLEADGATAIWQYAPGYLDEKGLALANMEALTGIKLQRLDKKDFVQVEVADKRSPYLKGFGQISFGTDMQPEYFTQDIRWMPWHKDRNDYQFSPLFYVDDRQAQALGKLRGTGKTGLAVKRNGKFTSVYSAAPMLNPDIIRNIAEEAGVHVYSKGHDLVYASSRYLGVKAAKEGECEILLPRKTRVTDALSGQVLSDSTDKLVFNARQFEARVFRLGQQA